MHCPLEATPVPTAAPMSRAVTTAPALLLVTSWGPMGRRAWVCGQVGAALVLIEARCLIFFFPSFFFAFQILMSALPGPTPALPMKAASTFREDSAVCLSAVRQISTK